MGNIGKYWEMLETIETSNFLPGNAKHVDDKPGYKEVCLPSPHPPANFNVDIRFVLIVADV